MTKGKKKKELAIEEKLEQALVPREEWPYEVPENWCWVRLGSVISTSKEKTEDFSDYNIIYIGLENIEKDSGIVSYGTVEGVKSLKNVFHAGQILYGKLRPYLNKHDVSKCDGVCSTDILVFDTKSNVLSKYVDYYFNQEEFIDYAVSNSKGINLPRVSEQIILKAKFPLPPLPEQQRIVDRIESLFSKLDEAKEKAQEALDSFEERRAAILHKAFSGELTEKWREENGVRIDKWEIIQLSDCSTSIGDGLHGTPVFDNNGEYYFVNGNNFQRDHLNIKPDTKKVNEEEYKKNYINLSKENTVFVSINGTLGKTSFYNDEPIILGKSACYINVNERIDKYYLRYFFETKEFIDYANEKATGSTIKNLGLKAIRNLEIMLPSISEQRKIVMILDDIIKKECMCREIIYDVLFQIDILKKSILSQAFRGELGTNNLLDQSAIELLKSIL